MILQTEVKTTTAITAEIQYIEVNARQFAYRRFGRTSGKTLVFLQDFLSTMDHWDPAVLDGFAGDREVVIFNNAGVASSGGETPDTITEMAYDAAAFVKALGLVKIDLLGFSLGGMVAQQFTLNFPELVNRVILISTGPRGGVGMEKYPPEVWAMFNRQHRSPDECNLEILFAPSASSQKAGWAFLDRIRSRTSNRDTVADIDVFRNQLTAIETWGVKQVNNYAYLKQLKGSILLISGHTDVIIPSVNSFILQQNLPYATLIIYPDSNHAPHNQFPELFVQDATDFLDAIKY